MTSADYERSLKKWDSPEDIMEIQAMTGFLTETFNDSLAREIINAREYLSGGMYQIIVKSQLGKYLSLMAYGCEYSHRGRKRSVPVDVNKMVETWVPLIKSLAIAHDIDERDAASSALDEQLAPLLAAPVAQLREFYRKLTAALKADKSVPWAVWKLFDFWGVNVLDKLDKEEMVGLKTEVAKRIAESSMAQIPREDWINAMIGALQWRSPEKLEKIESEMKSGHRPRVRGKESCLFLQVNRSEVML